MEATDCIQSRRLCVIDSSIKCWSSLTRPYRRAWRLVILQAAIKIDSLGRQTNASIIRTVVIWDLNGRSRSTPTSTNDIHMSAINVPLAVSWPIFDREWQL